MSEVQHDNHCWMTWEGESWKIHRRVGDVLVLWRVERHGRDWDVLTAHVDISALDVEGYTTRAARLLLEHW